MFLRILPFCLLLVACSSQSPNLNDGRIATINEQVMVQTDRIVELERMITELNQRVEKVEFIYLEKRDRIVAEKQSATIEAPMVAQLASPEENLQQSVTTESPYLNTKIANRTSAIVPLAVMEEDRASLSTLDVNSIESKNFEFAFAHLEQNQFANAWRALEELTGVSLNSSWQAKLIFWKAICFEAMHEEKKAVSLYNELQANFHKEERAPLALLRQASLFLRLNEKDLSKLTLQKLVKDYPRSKEALQAQSRLKEMR